MLPPITQVKLPSLTLPTAWQTVILRNYGYVPVSRIAKTLGCDEQTVRDEAKKLNLVYRDYESDFQKNGYITIIRNNWYLLPYDQLLTLLDISEEKLDFILKNDDFLDVKLGRIKPEVSEVRYSPLTKEQESETQYCATLIEKYSVPVAVKPFDFFAENKQNEGVILANGMRIVHGYLSPCGDAFSTKCEDTLPSVLLKKYQSAGVNGIWLHALLSALSPYPFAPRLSQDYKQKRENLKAIISRCKKYGIKVFLYLNEPRALPSDSLPQYDHLIGWKEKRTLCFEKQEVRDYLYNAVYDLCNEVPEIGGFFTITMSENATHCNYVRGSQCPVCKDLPPEKTCAEINNVILRAIKNANSKAELIANLWGWSPFMGWTESQTQRGLELLDQEVSVMCVSEFDLDINKGGIKGKIIDYSISNPGPSQISKDILAYAQKTGHKTYAKIQASNSWECSAVPYIPAFDLVHEHLCNLNKLGVKNLFLTWTLGGYPSPAIEIASQFNESFDLDEWYEQKFGKDAQTVHDGIKTLCSAFREYPFSITMLYNSPKTLGPANLWEIEREEKTSTMVCYAFDDYENWLVPYPYEIYISQFEKVINLWKEGVTILEKVERTPSVEEIIRYAKVALCHFTTDLLQTKYSFVKRLGDREQMKELISKEKQNAIDLLNLFVTDAKIGYEASNHYFYTYPNLIEKILRMEKFESLIYNETRP